MPPEALPTAGLIFTFAGTWSTTFSKDIAFPQAMNPAQWQLFDGAREWTPTTAVASVPNLCSGSMIGGPVDLRPPEIVFTNTDNDFKDAEGVQVPSYTVVPTVI